MSWNRCDVRVAREADYAALGRVFAEAERLHREALPHIFRRPPGLFPSAPLFRQWVSDAHSAVFVADDAGELVGFVTVRTDSAPSEEILRPRAFAMVDLLAVRSDRRRHGIGRSLMDAVHSWAGGQGLRHVSLNVWEFNEPALGFYRAVGYQTVSRQMEHALPGPTTQASLTRLAEP